MRVHRVYRCVSVLSRGSRPCEQTLLSHRDVFISQQLIIFIHNNLKKKIF